MEFTSLIVNQNGDFTHHAFLIEGDRDVVRSELFSLFEGLGVSTKGNPDFLHLAFESFGIDEGRAVKELRTGKAVYGTRRHFIIETGAFTHEAQNSLLKVFEDPLPHTHFFLIIPSADILLPTLRSRFFIVPHHTKYSKLTHSEGNDISAETFFKKSMAERLKVVAPIIENKNKEEALRLVDDIERLTHKRLTPGSSPGEVAILEEIARLRAYLHDRSPSTKLILEHLALVLPERS